MTYKLFNKLWKDALDQPDAERYIGEYGYPEWFDEISENLYEIVKILENIHEVAHMPFRKIIERSGLSRADFCERFCLAKSTVDKWVTGNRNCPDYYRLALCRELGILEVNCDGAQPED